MAELENTIAPCLENKIKIWKRYLNDTMRFAKVDSTNLILTALNTIHSHKKFTIEIEKDSVIPFFNVLVIKQELEYEQNYTVKIQILIYIFFEILLHQLNGRVK